MGALLKFADWVGSHRDVAFDLLRMYLGVGLLVRGIFFIADPASYTALIGETEQSWLTAPLVMYLVAAVHIVGGALLTVGLFTRIAALVQIPILLVAVFLVHLQGGLFTASQSFEFSALVLFLLILVFLHGSGRWSLAARVQPSFSPFSRYGERLDRYGDFAFELLRIYLGVGLFVRGVLFISNSAAFASLVGDSSSAWLTSIVLIHYVALAHLVGGVMLAIGLFTRAAALVQLPILLGAVLIIHFQGGLIAPSQSLEFSALVLFLLILVFLWGSGRLSVDQHILERPVDAELYRHVGPLGARMTSPAPLMDADVELDHALPTCSCGHDRTHPQVTAQARYSLFGAMYFLVGITGPPKEIVFRCTECGEIVEVSRTPEVREQHRYP